MPKKNHIIPRFNGLVLDIAKEDLPDGVLANNTTNARFDRSGNIIGFTPPSSYISLGITTPYYSGRYKSEQGSKIFHIQSGTPPTINTYAPGDISVTQTGLSHQNISSDKISHVQRLNNLVIGTGNGANNKPIWYGTHFHNQFGNTPSATPECIDAELVNPTQISNENSFPRAKGIARTGSRTYMISNDSTRIYKFNGTTKEAESVVRFQSPQCICADSVSGFVWVYDSQSKTLFRVDSDLNITNSIFLSGMPDDEKIVIDIAVANENIWLLRDYVEKDFRPMEGYLYRVQRSTMNTNAVPVNNSYTNIGGRILGVYYEINDHDRSSLMETTIKFGKKGLIVHGNSLYLAVELRTKWLLQYEQVYEQDGTYRQDPDREVYGDNLYLLTDGVPLSEADTGNTILLSVSPEDPAGTIELSQVNLLIGNQEITKIDWITYDSSYGYLWNYSYQDDVHRLRVPFSGLTGGVSLSVSILEVPGFRSNNIEPVIAMDHIGGYFFSMNSPPTAGLLSGAIVSSLQESSASIEITPIPGGFTEEDKQYYYAFSFIYDGYMESPLSEYVTGSAQPGFGFTVKLKIPEENINRRVSAVNIYRAVGSIYGREEYFRLVDTVKLDNPLSEETDGSETRKIIEYVDRKSNFEQGPSFESNSGIPETMKNTMVHYGMSVMIDDYMFVGDCYHPEVDDAAFMIFRSLPYSICSFNWEVDVLRLPTVPTAMAQSNGRLLVFDESDMHVIDPGNMVIEQTIHGMGAVNQRAIAQYKQGLFIAGNTHLWQYSGSAIDRPSDRITLHSGANLSAFSTSPLINTKNALRDYEYLAQNASDFHLSVNEHNGECIVSGVISGDTIVYVYNYETKQWSRYVNTSYAITDTIATDKNQTLAYKTGGVDYLFGSSNPEPGGDFYIAELVPFDAGDANIDKWFYEVRVDYLGDSSNIAVKVAVDQGNYTPELSEVNGIFTIPIGSAEYQGKSLRVRIEGSVKIKSVSIIYRIKQVRS